MLESLVTHGRNAEGSRIRYSYIVNGKTFTSGRVQAGFLSGRAYQSEGGRFSENSPAGSSVTVYYDASDPGFSFLAYGWPKWSAGFSMAVWGIVLSYRFPLRSFKKQGALAYSRSRASAISGLIIIAAFPIILGRPQLLLIVFIFALSFVCAFGNGMARRASWENRIF